MSKNIELKNDFKYMLNVILQNYKDLPILTIKSILEESLKEYINIYIKRIKNEIKNTN